MNDRDHAFNLEENHVLSSDEVVNTVCYHCNEV